MANHCPPFLRERGKQVQDERVYVTTKVSDYERYAVYHQAADEVNVAAEPIELGDSYGASLAARFAECGGKLRTPLQSISALASLDFNEHAAKHEVLCGGEAFQRLFLRLKSEPRTLT